MSVSALVVFPHQLFEKNELAQKVDLIFCLEHPYYFTDFNYHKQKLVLHRASLSYYADFLSQTFSVPVYYIDYRKAENAFAAFASHGVTKLYLYDPVDMMVLKKVKRARLKSRGFAFLRIIDSY